MIQPQSIVVIGGGVDINPQTLVCVFQSLARVSGGNFEECPRICLNHEVWILLSIAGIRAEPYQCFH